MRLGLRPARPLIEAARGEVPIPLAWALARWPRSMAQRANSGSRPRNNQTASEAGSAAQAEALPARAIAASSGAARQNNQARGA